MRLSRLWLLLCTALFWMGPSGAWAQELSLAVERHQLDNGLRIVLSPDRSVPVVSVALYYDVGSRNEEQGRSGFAHLFEHMMFQGSDSVGKMEHFQFVNQAGGTANGTTSHDRTNYFETLPSHQLELGLWLEADRMRSLAITEENYENQREVVINEYRQSYENQPYGLAFLRINALAFGDYFPYAHSTIGSMDDLRAAPLADVQAFWQGWYGPNNAVLAVAGDFDSTAALELIQQHFGPIASRPTPPWQDPGFAGQTEERYEEMYDPLAPLAAFFLLHHIPPNRSPDHYALELLTDIMGDGESSRLHRRLVEEEQVCVQARSYTDDRRGPDLINFEGVVAANRSHVEARSILDDEINRVIADGVTEQELTKAHNRRRASMVFGLQTSMRRAQRLAEFELYHGDAGLLRTELNHYLAVTQADIQRVAAQYLIPTTRSVLVVMPESHRPQPAPEQPTEQGAAPTEPNPSEDTSEEESS